jgi:hypothetical protein
LDAEDVNRAIQALVAIDIIDIGIRPAIAYPMAAAPHVLFDNE